MVEIKSDTTSPVRGVFCPFWAGKSGRRTRQDKEEAAPEGTFRPYAVMDSFAEGLDVSDLHLTCEFHERQGEVATFIWVAMEMVWQPAVLRTGQKGKTSLLPFLVQPVHALFWPLEEYTLASWLAAIFPAWLRQCFYRHGHEIEADDVARLKPRKRQVAVLGVYEREPFWMMLWRNIGLDVEVFSLGTEKDVMCLCGLTKDTAHDDVMKLLPIA